MTITIALLHILPFLENQRLYSVKINCNALTKPLKHMNLIYKRFNKDTQKNKEWQATMLIENKRRKQVFILMGNLTTNANYNDGSFGWHRNRKFSFKKIIDCILLLGHPTASCCPDYLKQSWITSNSRLDIVAPVIAD